MVSRRAKRWIRRVGPKLAAAGALIDFAGTDLRGITNRDDAQWRGREALRDEPGPIGEHTQAEKDRRALVRFALDIVQLAEQADENGRDVSTDAIHAAVDRIDCTDPTNPRDPVDL